MNEAKRDDDSTALFRDRPFHLAYIPPVFSKWDFYETISWSKIVSRSYPKRQ